MHSGNSPSNTLYADGSPIGTDDEIDGKSCKICYDADRLAGSDWISPCKCSGSIKWVHSKCLLRWIENAPYVHQHICSMCRYEYRRHWRLKPLARWTWPKLHISIWDTIEILLDVYSTVKLVRNTTAAIQGTKSVLAQMFYFVFWKMFIFTNHRIQYYKSLCMTLFSSIFEPRIQNAVMSK